MSLINTSMYTATHQVLYHYLVTRFGCQQVEASLNKAKSICNNIIKESEILHRRHNSDIKASHEYIQQQMWVEWKAKQWEVW